MTRRQDAELRPEDVENLEVPRQKRHQARGADDVTSIKHPADEQARPTEELEGNAAGRAAQAGPWRFRFVRRWRTTAIPATSASGIKNQARYSTITNGRQGTFLRKPVPQK